MNLNKTFLQNKKRLKIELGLYLEKKERYDELKKIANEKAVAVLNETNKNEILDKIREIYGERPDKHIYENNWLKKITVDLESDPIFLRRNEEENLAIIKFLLEQNNIFYNSKIREKFFVKKNAMMFRNFELKEEQYKLLDFIKEKPTKEELKIITRFFRTHYKIFKKDLALYELKIYINNSDPKEFDELLQKYNEFYKIEKFAFQMKNQKRVTFKEPSTLSTLVEFTEKDFKNEKQLFLLFLGRKRRW